MRTRIAQKIVNRVEEGSATPSSYSVRRVRRAFEQFRIELTEDHLKPWTDHAAEKRAEAVWAKANRPVAKAKRAAKQERIKALAGAKQRRREEAKAKDTARRVDELAAVMESVEGGDPPENLAVAAGREAFKEAIESGVDEVPESVTLEPAEEPEPKKLKADEDPLDSMTAGDLKKLAKERGLTGYSKMKKAELIDLLYGL